MAVQSVAYDFNSQNYFKITKFLYSVSTDVYHTLLFPWIAHAAASRADFMCSSD